MKIDGADIQNREARIVDRVPISELGQSSSGELIVASDSGVDHHEISSLAQRALESVNSPQPKVEELRRQVEAGSYKPDSTKVSQKLVESMFE